MIVRTGYTAKDVAKLLDLPPHRVRSFIQAGLVDANRGSRGEYRISFQSLVLLRAAKDLASARVPQRRIKKALKQLRDDLPADGSLSGLQIAAEADRVVVHDGTKRWNPESGQLHFNFDVADLARRAAPIAKRQAQEARGAQDLSADDWDEMAGDWEAPAPDEARRAYRRALDLDPDHADAHVNLGRIHHEMGELAPAEYHYRAALQTDPDEATAAFNLGVVLEDRNRPADALAVYEKVLHADPAHADAHYNAAGLCKRLGRHAEALRHLKSYKELC